MHRSCSCEKLTLKHPPSRILHALAQYTMLKLSPERTRPITYYCDIGKPEQYIRYHAESLLHGTSELKKPFYSRQVRRVAVQGDCLFMHEKRCTSGSIHLRK